MRRFPILSTTLQAVGYDHRTCVLEAEFRTGEIYRYYLVPRSGFEGLMRADSKGSYFNRKIRDRFRYEHVC